MQAIESVHPPHVALGEADRTNICYLAFPDSNSGVMGDSQFHFRLRLNQSAADQGGRSIGSVEFLDCLGHKSQLRLPLNTY